MNGWWRRGRPEGDRRGGAAVWGAPYSPDYNPIEKLWSKVKAWLRRAAATTLKGLSAAIAEALRTVTPEECWNYFMSCGYCR